MARQPAAHKRLADALDHRLDTARRLQAHGDPSNLYSSFIQPGVQRKEEECLCQAAAEAVQRLLSECCPTEVHAALHLQKAGPLQVAAFLGNHKAVEALLAAGAPVDASTTRLALALCTPRCQRHRLRDVAGGSTALHLARTAECAAALVAAGAAVEVRDGKGRTPLEADLVGSVRDSWGSSCKAVPLSAGGAEIFQAPQVEGANTLLELIWQRQPSYIPDVIDVLLEDVPPWQRRQRTQRQTRKGKQASGQQQQDQQQQQQQQQEEQVRQVVCSESKCSIHTSSSHCGGDGSDSSRTSSSWLARLSQKQLKILVLAAADCRSGRALPRLLSHVGPLLSHRVAVPLLERVLQPEDADDAQNSRGYQVQLAAVAATLQSCGQHLRSPAIHDADVAALLSRAVTSRAWPGTHEAGELDGFKAAEIVRQVLRLRPQPLTATPFWQAMAWAAYAAPPWPQTLWGAGFPPYGGGPCSTAAGIRLSQQQQQQPWEVHEQLGAEVLAALLSCCTSWPWFQHGTEEAPIPIARRTYQPVVWEQQCPYAWLATLPLASESSAGRWTLPSETAWKPYYSPGSHRGSVLRAAEVLRQAGVKPLTLHWARDTTNAVLHNVCPLIDHPSVADTDMGRLVRLVAEHPTWSPATNHLFPVALRKAVLTLLLIARRQQQERRQHQKCASTDPAVGWDETVGVHQGQLSDLTSHLLHHLISTGAYPVWDWI
ncbi:hypothetical protein N2152v2_007290 [Parachlorella kessleri]